MALNNPGLGLGVLGHGALFGMDLKACGAANATKAPQALTFKQCNHAQRGLRTARPTVMGLLRAPALNPPEASNKSLLHPFHSRKAPKPAAMPDTLKITLAQLNQSVGDLAGNAAGMLAARDRAKEAGADLIAFPELQLVGYPPEDLVLKPSLVERATAELQKMAETTAAGGPAMLVGSVFVADGALHNGVALLDQGKVSAIRFKHELPNYGTFDEMRLFAPGPLPEPIIFRHDDWRADLRGHLASQCLPPSGRFRCRDLPVRTAAPMKSTRTRCALTAWPSVALRRRGCRWPI
jgi:hypothetical protein